MTLNQILTTIRKLQIITKEKRGTKQRTKSSTKPSERVPNKF